MSVRQSVYRGPYVTTIHFSVGQSLVTVLPPPWLRPRYPNGDPTLASVPLHRGEFPCQSPGPIAYIGLPLTLALPAIHLGNPADMFQMVNHVA